MNPKPTPPPSERIIDYLIVGHAAKDLTPQGPTLGGTIAYAGLTAQSLGRKVGVVTSSAPDLDFSPIQSLAVHNVVAPSSTTFENIYTANGRIQILHDRAQDLEINHIPATWRAAEIVHLAPIATEVDPQLAKSFPNALVGLTPQGWMRRWDDRGKVTLDSWKVTQHILPDADAVVLSIEDLGGDYQAADAMAECCRVLVVTEGPLGARVYAAGERHSVPAPARSEVDPTGAGDIFAAIFFSELRRSSDPLAAAAFANQLASVSVSRVGLASVPTMQEVHAALSEIAE